MGDEWEVAPDAVDAVRDQNHSPARRQQASAPSSQVMDLISALEDEK